MILKIEYYETRRLIKVRGWIDEVQVSPMDKPLITKT